MVNEATFSFEISEILYLDESYALKEMIELSLEPNVEITKIAEDVNLKGNLRLVGKYLKSDEDLAVPQLDFNRGDSKKLIEQVSEQGDYFEFIHGFPVNIFVPAYRLRDGVKTGVSIAAFDYEVINPLTIRFMATVEISGLIPEENRQKVREKTESPALLETTPLEVIPEPQPTKDIEPAVEVPNKHQVVEEKELRQVKNEAETIAIDEPEVIGRELKRAKQTDQIAVKTSKKQEEIKEIERLEQVEIIEKQSEEMNTSSANADINYLTNLFDANEEKQAKLQMCIVQKQDTIDTICDRFSIKKSELMKQNNLDDETLQIGKILFISLH